MLGLLPQNRGHLGLGALAKASGSPTRLCLIDEKPIIVVALVTLILRMARPRYIQYPTNACSS
ncbi:hypothetical protein PTT_09760 [Pyrenophora teres f. teres 0-1]|uniref:Uncharacterized protein n=1 Tax=Pyrenophora teres f. teres (strain 0-1) TaxID=861557 RepID=E3RMQ6_PYRTT|nr:hypothetical protein PTT_09760 [Pyrenophora teres f. teres 0-1]